MKPGPGFTRVNFIIQVELHRRFKAAAAARGENMTDVLLACIEEYVRRHAAAPRKASRK